MPSCLLMHIISWKRAQDNSFSSISMHLLAGTCVFDATAGIPENNAFKIPDNTEWEYTGNDSDVISYIKTRSVEGR